MHARPANSRRANCCVHGRVKSNEYSKRNSSRHAEPASNAKHGEDATSCANSTRRTRCPRAYRDRRPSSGSPHSRREAPTTRRRATSGRATCSSYSPTSMAAPPYRPRSTLPSALTCRASAPTCRASALTCRASQRHPTCEEPPRESSARPPLRIWGSRTRDSLKATPRWPYRPSVAAPSREDPHDATGSLGQCRCPAASVPSDPAAASSANIAGR